MMPMTYGPGDKIFFATPCMDHRIDVDCMLSIMKKVHEHGGRTAFLKGISDIAFARAQIAHQFLKSDCDWFMLTDSDIYFTDQDWEFLWEGEQDLVFAPYAKKIPGEPPTSYGLGFCRVHRRVFKMLDDLQTDEGVPIVQRFYLKSEILGHYFWNGVSGDSRWVGEDRGFFTLCRMAGVNHREEKRCRLGHGGRFTYGYPNQDNGAQFWKQMIVAEEERDEPVDNTSIDR